MPACRTLDCVSILIETAGDAALVLASAAGPDPKDAYSRQPAVGAGASPWACDPAPEGGSSRFRFGVPSTSSLEWFGDTQNPALYAAAVKALTELGGEPTPFDLAPFLAAAQLLYKGSWVAERHAAIATFFASHRAEMDSTVASIIGGARYSATDAFQAAYQLEALRVATRQVWTTCDVLLLPTAPRTYTVAEVAESPIDRNSHLGFYTNFVNLLDLAAVAAPAGMRPDGLPFGVSLIGQAFTEQALLHLADRLHRRLGKNLGGSTVALSDTSPMSLPSSPPGVSPDGSRGRTPYRSTPQSAANRPRRPPRACMPDPSRLQALRPKQHDAT